MKNTPASLLSKSIAILTRARTIVTSNIVGRFVLTKTLAQENEIFRAMLECLDDQIVMLHDAQDSGKVVYANAAACRHFGTGLETILSWWPADYDPHYDAEIRNRIIESFQHAASFQFESEHRTVNGELIPVEISANRFEHKGRLFSICIVRDLRSRRAAETHMLELQKLEAEQENARRLTRFAQSAPGFMYTVEQRVDGTLVMTYASPAVENVYGLGLADVMADVGNIYALIVPEDFPHVLDLIEKSSRDQSPFHAEYRIQHSTKGIRWMEAASMPDLMENGSIQWHGFVTDITERKETESALADSRNFLTRIIETMADPVFVKDKDHRWVLLNQAFCNLIGHDRDDLIGKSDYDFFPKHEADIFWEKDESVFASGRENTNEEDFTDSQGNKRTIITKKTRYTDALGQMFLVGVITDISDRKQMEEQLAAREQEFRTLIENAPDNIIRYARDTRIVYLNPVLEKTLGQPAEEVIGKRTDELYPGIPAMQEYQKWLEHVISTGQTAEYLMISGQDNFGRPLYDNIRIAPEFSPKGEIIGAIAIGRDLTTQKRLEMELARREQEFRTLSENSPDMIIRYDLECRRTYVNQAFLEATGARIEDILGKPVSAIAWWSLNMTAQEFEQRLRDVIETGMPISIRLQGKVPATQQAHHTLVRVVPEYDHTGQIESLMAVVRDVTDLILTEQALQQREQYQRALLDNFPFFVWLKDVDSRLLAVNQQYARVAGVSNTHELEGKTDFDLFPHDLAAGYIEDDRMVLASGIPKNVVEKFRDEHGELRWMETYKSPMKMGDAIIGTVGFSRDITEQIQVQAELANRERELRLLVDNTPDVIIRYDRDCRRTYISGNYEQVYGIAICAVRNKKPTEIWGRPRKSPEEYESWLMRVMDTGSQADFELDWYGTDGEYVCQALRAVPEYDAAGNIVSVLTFSRDVSETKRAGMKLRASEQEFRTLVEHSPEMLIRYDKDCQRLFVNSAYLKASGLSREEALRKPLSESWIAENITSETYEAWLRQVMERDQPANILLEWTGDDGCLLSHDMRAVPEYDLNGQLKSILVIGHNITELRQAAIGLRQREQEFRALVENTPDTVVRYDQECRRIYANPSMVEEAGVTLTELLGKTPTEFPGGEQAAAYQERIRQVFESGENGHFELRWSTGDGFEVCSHIRLTPELGINGEVKNVLAVGRDITEIDVYRKQIHNMAFFDNLTALPNRSLLLDRISQTIADASWHGSKFGLMLLDLDRFKEINDTLGHGVGDLLLREVADRLLQCVRSYDTVARLGGDEFAILLPEVRVGNDLATVARKILASFEHPFVFSGREIFISSSIGIAIYPADSGEIDALFKYADSAMYHAKKQGRNNFQFYSKELTARSSERMQLEAALRRAQKNKELELFYQPQVDVVTGTIIGAEALLRWNRSDQGVVTPDRFIPVAEETGLIVNIGEWVLLEACKAAMAWNRDSKNPIRIAVNLSTRQFIQNDLVASVRGILAETQCRPEWLKLEITESLLLEDSSHILNMLHQFNDMGLSISIDDFGTGYSALSYLNRFPVDQIKIDRSFVRDIPHDRDKSELVKAMISIAQALNMELVAEGVETHQQADYLQAHGCRVVQGYLYGKPMPHHEFAARLMATGNSVETMAIPS